MIKNIWVQNNYLTEAWQYTILKHTPFMIFCSLVFVLYQILCSIKRCVPSKVIIHRSSSIKCHLPSKVVFRQRVPSIRGQLSSKVIFHQIFHFQAKVVFHQKLSHQKSSSIKGCLPSKDIFHQISSFIKGCLPSKVVFQQSLSSIKGCLN